MSDDPFSGATPIHGAENVRPLRGQTNAQRQDVLKPRAKALSDAAVWAGNVRPQLERPYVVKGWLDRNTTSVIYGPSNVGKSFLALDIAHHVSKGREWAGRRVRKGRAMYVAAEGGSSFLNRVAALDDPEFWVLARPMTFTGPDSQAIPFTEFVLHLVRTGGGRIDLVVIDTLSRVMGNRDENHAPDISDLTNNLDKIRSATDAHIMLIHHTGKDAARGARGHSSLRAAIDCEVELTRDDQGIVTAEVRKQRDGPTGYKFAYRLRQVELGYDQDGDVVATCVVDPVRGEEASKPSISGQVEKALEILSALITREDNDLCLPSAPRVRCARVDDWAEACTAPGAISNSPDAKNRRRAWLRCSEQLVDAGLIQIDGDFVGMAGST